MQPKFTKGVITCRTCREKKPKSEFEQQYSGLSRICRSCCIRGKVAVCRRCRERKPHSEFPPNPLSPLGRSLLCNECTAPTATAWRNGLLSEGTAVCRSCKNRKPKLEFYRRGPRGVSFLASQCASCALDRSHRAKNILRKYGITWDQFDAMLKAQNSGCAVCGEPLELDEGSKGRVNIDHNHETGEVRAVLCHPCNTKLGAVESPGFLPLALAYLKKHGVNPLKVR